MDAKAERWRSLLREVRDFPKPGIRFQDIDPLLNDAAAFAEVIEAMSEPWRGRVDLIAGAEARGYIFSAAMAMRLGAGVCLLRKPGKLPAEKVSVSYGLEYGKNELQLHKTAVKKGQRVLLVDDLLATGGTVEAGAQLVRMLEGEVIGAAFLVELKDLNGRKFLAEKGIKEVHSLIEIE